MKRLVLILVLVTLTSCLGSKKISEKSSVTTQTTEIKKDSTAKETINKVIKDEATFKVAESNTGDAGFDIRVNDAVANILRNINFQKTSGDNSYSVYYDEKLKELKAQIEVGETSNKEVVTNSTSEKSFDQKTDEYLSKKITAIPWWVWLIVGIWFLPQILAKINPIINLVKKHIIKQNKNINIFKVAFCALKPRNNIYY